MRKRAIHILLLLVANYCNGQSIDASLPQRGYLFINKYVDYLATKNELPITNILTEVVGKGFKKVADKKVIFKGYNPLHYWYRFSISNHSDSNRALVLLLGQLGIRNAELWSLSKNKLIFLGRTGYQYPFSLRPYLFAHHAFPLSISSNTTDTFYISIDESHSYKVIAFALLNPKVMKKMETRFYFLFGIFTGILLFFAITNIYLYFSMREKINLWYSLYILSILFFMFKHEGLDSQFLGLDNFYGYRSTYMGAFAILSVGLLTHVVQKFLTNISNRSSLYKVTSFIKWICWAGAFIQWIVFIIRPDNYIEVIVFEVFNKVTLVALLLILANCIYSFVKGFKPSLFILAGLSVFLAGAITRNLFISSESYLFPPSLFEIGLVAEAIIISFGLMQRYRNFKDEKNQLLIKLETQSSEAAKEILNVQQAEQQRIAIDLHDELGGNLAALKMALQGSGLPPKQYEVLRKLIDNASESTRNIAHNLMPPQFEETPLVDLMNDYFKHISNENSCNFSFYSSGNNHFDKMQELTMYRIIMEISNNICRHAVATEATIQLVYFDTYLEIMVEDNGKGISQIQHTGMGMENIKTRVAYLKGEMKIDSGKTGTTIVVQIPYE